MTQQPNEQNNNNESSPPKIEKLLIDDLSNFQFHAAYLVYEEAFDKASDAESKEELNQNIQDLKDNKISAETFYGNVSRFQEARCSPSRKILYADSAQERLAQEDSASRKN